MPPTQPPDPLASGPPSDSGAPRGFARLPGPFLRRYDRGGNRSGAVLDDRPAQAAARPKRRAGFFRRWWGTFRSPSVPLWKKALLAVASVAAFPVAGLFALVLFGLALVPSVPDGSEIRQATNAQPTVVFSANGQKLTQFEAPFQEWVPLDSIPVHVVQALIATEDRRFYQHYGIDARRSVAALWYTFRGDTQGGSTITQQLARNLFPLAVGSSTTPTRKMREWIAAFRIERAHSKREILESYLNTAPFLYNAVGLEMAARTYFSRPARELTVEEGATLVAMLKGPAFYNPHRHPERARERRNLVLGLMAEQGALSPAEAESLRALPLGLRFQRQEEHESAAPHFTQAVRHELELWAEAYGYDLNRDGLVVWTTLDMGFQRDAEAAVRRQAERLQAVADVEWSRRAMPALSGADAYAAYRERVDPFAYYWASHPRVVEAHVRGSAEFEGLTAGGVSSGEALARLAADAAYMDSLRADVTRLEAGMVALDPHTGAVRAYVGSRDFDVEEYDHAGVARRQPGSTFKPFVYAAALQAGYGPQDRFRDAAVAVDMGNGQTWRPTNSGRISGAELTLADALAYSKNTITVRIATELGAPRIAAMARRMGIESELDVVPSLALGTSPVTLLEMVSAYGTIANEGRRIPPRLIERIERADGYVLETFEPAPRQAMAGREARTLLGMLQGAVERGTGAGLRAFGLRGPYAGKTGTTQRNADGWFIGMHPDLVTGAWVGFNDQRVQFRSTYWGQGGHNALLLVGDFFQRVQDRLPAATFPAPPEPLPPFEPPPAVDTLDLDRYFARYETESMAEFDPYYADERPDPAAPSVQPAYDEMGYGTGGSAPARPAAPGWNPGEVRYRDGQLSEPAAPPRPPVRSTVSPPGAAPRPSGPPPGAASPPPGPPPALPPPPLPGTTPAAPPASSPPASSPPASSPPASSPPAGDAGATPPPQTNNGGSDDG